MKKYFKISIIVLVSVTILNFFVLPLNKAYAGVCGDLVILKNGTAQRDNGSFSIPANDKAKWELKITTNRTKTTCTDDYAKVTLVFINQQNQQGAAQTIVAEQKIGTGTEINKTITLQTSAPQGIYSYTMDSRKDLSATSFTSNGLRITLGSAGSASTGTSINVNTNVGANFNVNLDSSIGSFFNPLFGGAGSVPELITALIRILFALIGIAAVIVIIISGFRMVMASGNEQELTKAKQAITWAIVGLIVSLMAFSIVAIIQRLIQVGS